MADRRTVQDCKQDIKKVVRGCEVAIKEWILNRKETISTMERVADRIENDLKRVNQAKLVGSSIGVVTGLITGGVGLAAIVATGGLAAPVVAAGGIASMAGIGGSVVSFSADVRKVAILRKYQREMNAKFNEEIESYQNVIKNLARLGKILTKMNEERCEQYLWLTARINIQSTINVLTVYSMMNLHIAGVTGKAAGTKVFEAARVIAATDDIATVGVKALSGMGAEELITIGTQAAEAAANSTTAGMVLNKVGKIIPAFSNKVTSITKAAGQAAGKTAFKAGATEGTETITKAASCAATKAGRVAGKTLPFINFASAAWDCRESYRTYNDVYYGVEEVRALREKILAMKRETNRIVEDMYNQFADKTEQRRIKHPYPGVPTAFR